MGKMCSWVSSFSSIIMVTRPAIDWHRRMRFDKHIQCYAIAKDVEFKFKASMHSLSVPGGVSLAFQPHLSPLLLLKVSDHPALLLFEGHSYYWYLVLPFYPKLSTQNGSGIVFSKNNCCQWKTLLSRLWHKG